MADTGSGIGTPIVPGSPVLPGTPTAGVTTALPRTSLSLYRYAQIMGINPVHFSGAEVTGLFSEQPCSKVWPRHTWQSFEQASWEDLSWAIKDAEQTISHWLGYNVAPWWTMEEEWPYPKYRGRHFTNAINMNGQRPSICVQQGKIIAGGQRAATVVHAGVTVAYSDEDSDTLEELATIVATIPGGMTISDWRDVRVYYPSTGADPRWEIRPLDEVTVDAGAGTVTILAKAYQFVDQDLRSAMPNGGFTPINITTTNNYISTVDVYLEQNDATAQGSQLLWEQRPLTSCGVCSGVGCDECSFVTQDGCLPVRNGGAGLVVPTPATYSGGWASNALTIPRSPDKVKLWYYSGNIGEEYRMSLSSDPLDHWLANAIALLATSRLDREVCSCNNDNFKRLQRDMAFSSAQGNFLAISDEIKNAPFGSRTGEVLAYRAVKYTPKYITVAVL